MKQPRANNQQRHSSKKPMLPVFRQPRAATTKLNEFTSTQKSELFFNVTPILFRPNLSHYKYWHRGNQMKVFVFWLPFQS